MIKKIGRIIGLSTFVLTLSGCALFPQRDFVAPVKSPTATMRENPLPPEIDISPDLVALGEPALLSPQSFDYSFEFPLNFSSVTNTSYRKNFTSQHIAAKFPTSTVVGIADAIIDVGIGENWCDPNRLWPGYEFVTSTRSISGVLFNKVYFVDHAMGNQYHTTEYFTKKGDTCYAIVMLLHTTTAENFADTQQEAKELRQKLDAEILKINTVFERIVGTFRFRKIN